MIALLGTIGVGAGLVGASGGALSLASALFQKRIDYHRRAFVWIWLMVAGCLLAVLAMEIAILRDDFSMEYVANNSTRATPLLYKIATLWGALEGSLLLWAFVLCIYIAAAATSSCFTRGLGEELRSPRKKRSKLSLLSLKFINRYAARKVNSSSIRQVEIFFSLTKC